MGEFEFRQKIFETAVGGGTYMQANIVNFTIELENTVQGQNLNLGLLHCWDYGNGWALKSELWLVRTEGCESNIFVWSVFYVCIYMFLKLFKSNVIMVRNSNSSKATTIFSLLCPSWNVLHRDTLSLFTQMEVNFVCNCESILIQIY